MPIRGDTGTIEQALPSAESPLRCHYYRSLLFLLGCCNNEAVLLPALLNSFSLVLLVLPSPTDNHTVRYTLYKGFSRKGLENTKLKVETMQPLRIARTFRSEEPTLLSSNRFNTESRRKIRKQLAACQTQQNNEGEDKSRSNTRNVNVGVALLPKRELLQESDLERRPIGSFRAGKST
jgi:hypothetical protein